MHGDSMEHRIDEIRSWFNQELEPQLADGDLLENFHRMHPSKVFLRTLPFDATVLDVGAGDGGLAVFRKWPSPARPDLKLYAFSLEKGAAFDDYDRYELGDWNVARPDFDGMKFDAIMAVNFIEHIKSPETLIRWAASRLTDRGRLYIEWPSEESQFCPQLPELAEIGFDCICGNYFDDPTHEWIIPSFKTVKSTIQDAGLKIESSGDIIMPFIADELLSHYKRTKDVVSLQFAYWLKTGWLNYVVARSPESRNLDERDRTRKEIARQRPPSQEEFAEEMRNR